MLGHFLNVLDPEAEQRLLTEKMAPVDYVGRASRCVVGCAYNMRRINEQLVPSPEDLPTAWKGALACSVEDRYDELCSRFGPDRINTAIRDRVLQNQLYRTLRPQPV
jgi:hypothetical protein